MHGGLHHAVRHTDPETGFEHHGFLNVLARHPRPASTARDTPSRSSRSRPGALLDGARDARSGLAATRRWFTCFGSCSILEPHDDLVELGLVEPTGGVNREDCWVEGAAGSAYDVDNLPYGVFSVDDERPRVGVRIGDQVLDVPPVAATEMLDVHAVFGRTRSTR